MAVRKYFSSFWLKDGYFATFALTIFYLTTMRVIFLSLLLVLPFAVKAQLERAAFTDIGRGAINAFVTDYHALGVNPANLALGNAYNKKFTLGLAQITATNYGEGFTRSEMMDAIRNPNDELSFDEKFDAANRFANTAVAADVTILGLGFAVNTEKAGSFALSVGTRFTHFSRFNQTASNHLWRGFTDPYFDQWIINTQSGQQVVPNGGPDSPLLEDVVLGFSSDPQAASALYDGSLVRSMGYLEYNLGWGMQLFGNDNLKLHGGLGLKYLQGLFLLDVDIREGASTAYLAHTPALPIDFGEASTMNPSALMGDGLKAAGAGFGVDLGFTMEVGDQLRFSAAVTDIGSITFDGNVFSARDTVVFDIETTGVNSFNLGSQFDVFTGDEGLFEWEGERERRLSLPAMLRLGMAYQYNEKFQFGLDVALPFNEAPGSIDRLGIAAGIDYLPTSVLRFSTGFAAGDNYGFRVPFGINFHLGNGAWDVGVATRDLLFFVSNDRPNISSALGFLRFRFGTMDSGALPRFF